jgi:hypothetical protein
MCPQRHDYHCGKSLYCPGRRLIYFSMPLPGDPFFLGFLVHIKAANIATRRKEFEVNHEIAIRSDRDIRHHTA